MARIFRIPKSAYKGFEQLIAIGPERLKQLSDHLGNRELVLDVTKLAKELAAEIEYSSDSIEEIIRSVLIPLNIVRSSQKISAKNLLNQLTEMISQQNEEWYGKHAKKFQNLASVLEPFFLANGFFAMLSKTFQLLINHSIIAQDLKILTELRPVFDDDLSSAKAMVLTNTLVIDYKENDDSKTFHLAIDRSDLKTLQEQLDRAEKKSELLKDQAEQLGLPILIAGAELE